MIVGDGVFEFVTVGVGVLVGERDIVDVRDKVGVGLEVFVGVGVVDWETTQNRRRDTVINRRPIIFVITYFGREVF